MKVMKMRAFTFVASASLATIGLLASCAGPSWVSDKSTSSRIEQEVKQAAQPAASERPSAAVSDALLPPLRIPLPKSTAKQLDPRFDLVINKAPASQVLMGIVSGTRYSMLVSPEVNNIISVNLKDVTVFEALDALRELYGFEYKVDGTRILVEPQSIQTRVFQVNYIAGQRRGSSDTRVISGSVNSGGNNRQNQGSNQGNTGTQGLSGTGNNTNQFGNNNVRTPIISTSITTSSDSDFWTELTTGLESIVGEEPGRRVVVNVQSGVVLVRAMPKEIRNVESFLKLMQVNIERQVILEAKIVNVQLNDRSQAGVNWAFFGANGNRPSQGIAGNIGPNTQLASSGNGALSSGNVTATDGSVLNNNATSLGNSLFAVALQGTNFAALLTFLESQGDVQVLSSPRIATINNQKAVLKVGTDEFFVTGVSTSTVASTGATTTVPEVTLQPFFSGIALDVTPQIDKDDNIILHIHPSVSQVTTVVRQISLGGNLSQVSLPLASSNISETDSIVRTRDGRVIAIGGLMTENNTRDRARVPGLGDLKGIGNAFRQRSASLSKTELVILLKATVVQGSDSWSEDALDVQRRLEQMRRTTPAEAR